ncbi:MAG: hypothetical protein CMK23_10085 [Porticoccaceae bacterium]|nr:hypothetical protein [Porticoccaceae bacterium]MAK89369.1 hypothetical protein [Euryarchaeota archaeon]|tara:strand:- start:1353 stop:1859 length:507 start_codon:yes stop_codon:yes gene_type:complete
MSNDWNGFGSLDLSSIDAEAKPAQLPDLGVGKHDVTCKWAEIKDTTTGGKKVSLRFEANDGSGQVWCNLNVVNKSKTAQDIGRRGLKSYLMAMGHPTPDLPGDIKTLVGGQCEVVLQLGDEYMGQKRVEVQYFNVLASQAKRNAQELKGDGGGDDATKGGDLDDEIPF